MTAMGSARRQWVTSATIAEELEISPHTLRSWRSRGVGPPYYRLEGVIRYDREEVETWRNARRQAAENGDET